MKHSAATRSLRPGLALHGLAGAAELVDEGKNFTLHAGRQTGKTTAAPWLVDLRHTLDAVEGVSLCAAFDSDSRFVALGSKDHDVRVLDLERNEFVHVFANHKTT